MFEARQSSVHTSHGRNGNHPVDTKNKRLYTHRCQDGSHEVRLAMNTYRIYEQLREPLGDAAAKALTETLSVEALIRHRESEVDFDTFSGGPSGFQRADDPEGHRQQRH